MPFPLKIAPSHGGSRPHLIQFLGPIKAHNPNGILIGSAVFAQFTAECPCTLQWAAFPSKLPIPMGDLDPHLTHGSLGPPESANQTAS